MRILSAIYSGKDGVRKEVHPREITTRIYENELKGKLYCPTENCSARISFSNDKTAQMVLFDGDLYEDEIIHRRRNISKRFVDEITASDIGEIRLIMGKVKSIKQHIKLDHLFSYAPKGIWNQLFIALITVGLVEIMRVEKRSTQTAWEFYSLVRHYLLEPWEKVLEEINRKKSQAREGEKRERDQ